MRGINGRDGTDASIEGACTFDVAAQTGSSSATVGALTALMGPAGPVIGAAISAPTMLIDKEVVKPGTDATAGFNGGDGGEGGFGNKARKFELFSLEERLSVYACISSMMKQTI
jgi:hypothetical protein